MTTTRTHAAPWTLRRIVRMFIGDPVGARKRIERESRRPLYLSGREATARHLFGEACQWSRLDMAEYDSSPVLRGGWLAEADRRIAHAGSPDRHVAAHWGYTAAEWIQLPALVKVDKREQFLQARGLAS